MVRILTYAFLLAALFSRVEAEPWKSKGNTSVMIFYHIGDEENVLGLLDIIPKYLPEFESKLGVVLPYTPRIYVTSSQKEFDRITGERLPSWSHGVSSAQSGSVILKSPAFARDIATFNRTALHEIVHLLVGQKAGNSVPRWLNEGLAQLLSEEAQGKPLLPLSRALWAGKLIPLEALEGVDHFTPSEAELAYLESFHAADFLIRQYGWASLRNILNGLAQGGSWDEVLYQVIDTDQAGFEAAWRNALERSYRWIILMDVQLYLFAGATLLILLAGVVMMRRRRRTFKRWEEEESAHTPII
jgi:hypothetical protein